MSQCIVRLDQMNRRSFSGLDHISTSSIDNVTCYQHPSSLLHDNGEAKISTKQYIPCLSKLEYAIFPSSSPPARLGNMMLFGRCSSHIPNIKRLARYVMTLHRRGSQGQGSGHFLGYRTAVAVYLRLGRPYRPHWQMRHVDGPQPVKRDFPE